MSTALRNNELFDARAAPVTKPILDTEPLLAEAPGVGGLLVRARRPRSVPAIGRES